MRLATLIESPFRKRNQCRSICRSKLHVGSLAYSRGEYIAALRNYQSALSICEAVGDNELMIIALVKTAICLTALGQVDEAEELLKKAKSIEETWKVLRPNDKAFLLHELSVMQFRRGREDEGFEHEREALMELEKCDPVDRELLVLVLKQLAVYVSRDGEFSLAHSFLDDAVSIVLGGSENDRYSLMHGQLLVTKALLRIDEKRVDEANDLYDRGIMLIQMHIGTHNSKVAGIYRLFSEHLKAVGEDLLSAKFLKLSENVSNTKPLICDFWR